MRRILDKKWAKILLLLTTLIIFIQFIVFSFSSRPVQDDYSLLADISEGGFFSYLGTVWSTHGGNLTPMVLNAMALTTALGSFNFLSISIFSMITLLLVGVTTWYFIPRVRVGDLPFLFPYRFLFLGGAIIGFEGIFTPGLIGAYHFSSASAVHLWPIFFALIGMRLVSGASKNVVLIFILGFLAGNSNIAETLAITMTTLLVIIFPANFKSQFSSSRTSIFAAGLLLGAITIIASPGFWIRANENTNDGIPSTFSEFILRFVKSAAVFSIDVLTHPVIYIFAILGVVLQNKLKVLEETMCKWNYVEALFHSLLFSLILGASFAYPAWHQSLGLLFLLPVASFFFGARLGRRFKFPKAIILIWFSVVLSFALILITLRADILVWRSGSQWAQANESNICELRLSEKPILKNPEIRYPLFGLGIEDVQSWPWIRTTYLRWLSNVPETSKIDCELVN